MRWQIGIALLWAGINIGLCFCSPNNRGDIFFAIGALFFLAGTILNYG